MSEPEHFDPDPLRPGPTELLEQINDAFEVIGPYIDMTLEQFQTGIMRDNDPESEVALWCSITVAWLDYHEKFLGDQTLPDEEERKLLSALITISTGIEDVSMLNVPIEVGRRLLECYDGLGEE